MGEKKYRIGEINHKGYYKEMPVDPRSLLSSIIFEVLHKRGFAVEFCTAISKEVFKLVGFAYVDDSDLLQLGTDPIEVLTSM